MSLKSQGWGMLGLHPQKTHIKNTPKIYAPWNFGDETALNKATFGYLFFKFLGCSDNHILHHFEEPTL